MSGYGLFQPSILGMRSQTHNLNQIGTNVANVNTGGYRRSDVHFETLVSKTLFGQSDTGGVKPKAYNRFDVQGQLIGTPNPLDVAIVGDGFLMVSPDLTVGSDIFYTRDGSLEVNTVEGEKTSVTASDGSTISVDKGYLVDKHGYFVLGFKINDDGTFPTNGTASPMRVDTYAFSDMGQATTTMNLDINLDAADNVSSTARHFGFSIYDSLYTPRMIDLNFKRIGADNSWRMTLDADNLTSYEVTPAPSFAHTIGGVNLAHFNSSEIVDGQSRSTITEINPTSNIGVTGTFNNLIPGDTVTITDSSNNNGTYTVTHIIEDGAKIAVAETLVDEQDASGTTITGETLGTSLAFDSNGILTSDKTLALTLNWSDGATNTTSIDMSRMTQYAGQFQSRTFHQSGYGKSDMEGVKFDDKNQGIIVGMFADGTEREIFRVPLAIFNNPNGLDTTNGMFTQTTESGEPRIATTESSAAFLLRSGTHELSNVNMEQEFTRMIFAQTAYNMSATTFKTIDEMTVTARDLKA